MTLPIHSSSSCRKLIALLLIGALPSIALLAQSYTGRATGAVLDPTGAVVPKARLDVVNLATGIRASAQSNDQGIYQLTQLPPGQYKLTVEAPGFRQYVRSPLVVETGTVLSLDIQLEVGDTAESVTVSAETPLLQSDASSLNQVIENKSVANMPLASRRVGGLLGLLANVNMITENTVAGWVDFSMGGGRGRQQNWQLDGATVTGVPMFTAAVDMNPPVEAIQELRVEVNGYPAEYGRGTGGFISMTTKAGTNGLHGVLYEFLRNDKFDARRFFSPGISPRRYNVFGGAIGGPIIRDRTHYFFSYEGTQRRDGTTRTFNVPSIREVQGDFSQVAGTLLDPLTRQPFPGKIIPVSRMDPIGRQFAALYPAPNVPGAASGANNYRLNTVNKLAANNIVGRVDHTFGPRDRLTVRLLKYRGSNDNGSVLPVPTADPNATINVTDTFNITPGWFHQVNNSLFSEFRVGILNRWQEQPRLDDSGLAGQMGLRGVDPGGTPRFTVTGLSALGLSNQGRLIRPVRSVQLGEAISWFKGRHTVKFGGDWRRSWITDAQYGSKFGAFGFNDVAVGRNFGLAAVLLGWANSATVLTGEASPYMHTVGAYLQDDWKISARLTLNFGLRFDFDSPWREAENRRSGFDPAPINPVSGTPGVMTFAGMNGVGPYAHPFDTNNIGPRFGFAWRPAGANTVIRGGYGLIFGGIYDGSFGRVFSVGYGDDRTFVSPDNGLTPAILLKDGVPQPPPAPLGPGFGAVRVGDRVTTSPQLAMPDQRNPYAHHMNFTIQHQLRRGYLIEVGYLSNLGHRLAGRDININEIRPELRGAVQDQRLRPFPQYGNITLRSPNWGNSSYHAFTAKLERRFSGGLSTLTSYTWSKFIDDVEAVIEAAGAPGSGQQSYYERHVDKGLSGSDQRHRLVSSFVYDLPFGRGRRFDVPGNILNAIVGGWNLSGSIELRSGLPYGVTEASNRHNSFNSGSQRSNVTGSFELPADRPRSELVRQWFNTAAFAFPGNGISGNAARSTGIGPGYANVDCAVIKGIPIKESIEMQLRGEFFNTLNRPNFDNPNTSRGAAAFGLISNTINDGRFIQVGLRVVF